MSFLNFSVGSSRSRNLMNRNIKLFVLDFYTIKFKRILK